MGAPSYSSIKCYFEESNSYSVRYMHEKRRYRIQKEKRVVYRNILLF